MESFRGLALGVTVATVQEGGNSPVLEILLKSLEGTEEKFKEDVLKFSSVYSPVQDICHGICQAPS